jgi:ribosome maturation factor RimP
MSVNADSGNAQRGRRGPGHQTRATLMRLLEPVIADAGFDLEDVLVTPAGKRRQVRVIVDGDDGVSLDDVAVVSREISTALDDSDAMGSGPYVLEVTSPGVDRPLTQPRHWRRANGRLVRATLSGGEEITGRVTAADDVAVVLDTGGRERRLGYDELARGLVQVEFNRRGDDDLDGDED